MNGTINRICGSVHLHVPSRVIDLFAVFLHLHIRCPVHQARRPVKSCLAVLVKSSPCPCLVLHSSV